MMFASMCDEELAQAEPVTQAQLESACSAVSLVTIILRHMVETLEAEARPSATQPQPRAHAPYARAHASARVAMSARTAIRLQPHAGPAAAP